MDLKDIPIEISLPKLLEWLESRKIITTNWERSLQYIRLKVSEALNDMPSHTDLIDVLAGSYINYYHSLKIADILKTTEKSTQNFFGTYGSRHIHNWMQILRLYEKDNIYLADVAQLLQHINKEIPIIRKQYNKIGQIIEESQQRINDHLNTEVIINSARRTMCDKFNIKGVNWHQEFVNRIYELPIVYTDITNEIVKLENALKLYAEFACDEILPILRYIAHNGNTTVYEFIYRSKPILVNEPEIRLYQAFEDLNLEINVGDVSIDYGDDVNIINVDNNEIYNNEICFDIGMYNTNLTENLELDKMHERKSNDASLRETNNSIANGSEAYCILDSPSYRLLILDELHELNVFFQMRLLELRSDQSQAITFHFIEANNRNDLENVLEMSLLVQNIIRIYENETVDDLHRLKHSPKFALTMANKLQQQIQSINKSILIRDHLKQNIKTLQMEQNIIRKKIKNMCDASKKLQQQISNDLSMRYEGRTISIFGVIDSV